MGIVNELQESAEKDDVLTVMRKARRVASKLGKQDISQWLDHEQNGYPSKDNLPDYRVISCKIYYKINGYIPAGYGRIKTGMDVLEGFTPLDYSLLDTIGEVAGWIHSLDNDKNNGSGIYLPMGPEKAEIIRQSMRQVPSDILDQLSYMLRLNEFQLRDIPEQIKNRVLDWACKLEEAGIHGENQSFSNTEKQAASNVTVNIHDQSTKVTGNEIQGGLQVASPHAHQTTTLTINQETTEALDKLRQIIENAAQMDAIDKAEAVTNVNLIQELAAQPDKAKAKLKINEKLSAITNAMTISEKVWPYAKPLIETLTRIFG